MLDEAAGVSRTACASVVNVQDRALSDQLDNQLPDFVSAQFGMVPIAYARSQRRVTTMWPSSEAQSSREPSFRPRHPGRSRRGNRVPKK